MESLKYFFKGIYYGKFDIKRILLYLVSFVDYDLILNNFLNKYYNKIVNE